MLYTELLRLWDEAVQAVDAKDWEGSLSKLDQISDPTSRTLFNAASAHLALGELDLALKDLDLTVAKDPRLAVGFFQRAAVMMQLNKLEEALSDCIWAQKHMRGNMVIDYKQLGLRYKLYSWQVLYNAAGVYCRMGQWGQGRDVLLSASQEKGSSRGGNIEAALESIMREKVPAPLLVPEGVVFRPRKQDVEQLQERDFLGKAKVISSMIPNDDFGGFDPLRPQKPGFYEPKVEGSQDSRYMRVCTPYMGRGQGQLTVPGGAIVFIFAEEDRNGMVTVIYDGQRGLLPVSLLEPVDVKSSKSKRENLQRVPSGIPLPPGLKPPTRPKAQNSPAHPNVHATSTDTSPSSYTTVTNTPPPPSEPPRYTANAAGDQQTDSSQGAEAGHVWVKVHYTYTVAVSVPLDTTYSELKEHIAQKVGQPASQLRLRHKLHGSRVLLPLDEAQPGRSVQEVAEAGRATLWCQTEDPLAHRSILYQMVALYNYTAQGPEDLEFSEGETIDILGEINEEWLEGHCAGSIGIFPSCFAYRENTGENMVEDMAENLESVL